MTALDHLPRVSRRLDTYWIFKIDASQLTSSMFLARLHPFYPQLGDTTLLHLNIVAQSLASLNKSFRFLLKQRSPACTQLDISNFILSNWLHPLRTATDATLLLPNIWW